MDEKDHLRIGLLDVKRFIKNNDVAEITNPIFFKRDNIPTDDGLLSNDIFGISKVDRSNRFAYIDLGEEFLHPLVYTIWSRMDGKIADCIHGTKSFKVVDGELVEDPNGKTGITYLRSILKELKIKKTSSTKRDTNIEFIEKNKDSLYMDKCLVIPAYYRDVNSAGDSIGVGKINEAYNKLIISVRALKDTQDYGFSISNGTKGRIQDIICAIYSWFTTSPNLPKKDGIIRRAVLSKTATHAGRYVISGPDIDAEHYKDQIVDPRHCLVPLAGTLANLYPYIVFYCSQFFSNEFGRGIYKYMDDKGNIVEEELKDPAVEFSDNRIKEEIDRFIKGFSNRLIPIGVTTKKGKTMYMRFKGKSVPPEKINDPGEGTTIIDRDFTWCDLFYMAAEEVSKDKHILITRYPLESFYGQFPNLILVNSTIKKEPIYVDNKFYPNYPYIRQDMIGTDTSNMFIDTLQMSNTLLKAIGGDYDGDQVTGKAAYTIEANEELNAFLNSKLFMIDINGITHRTCSNEADQAMYNLTKVLEGTNLTEMIF